MSSYDSYDYRCGKLNLSDLESKLMDILMDFGCSIDYQGYDGGDYEKAVKRILKIIKGRR